MSLGSRAKQERMPEFRQLDERTVHEGRITRCAVGSFEAPDGQRFERDIIRHPGAVTIVPIDGDEIVFVRQYRPVLGVTLLELPAGTRDVAGEPPAETARRELVEEIGSEASELTELGSWWVAPGVSDERMICYAARDLRSAARSSHGPEERHMTVERVRVVDTLRMIAEGSIVDAKSIIGVLLATQS